MLKFSQLGLGRKFTLMLLGVFFCGVLLSGIALSRLLSHTTQAELQGRALMLMETMNSVRGYTSDEVRPELAGRLDVEFLPQTVPSYSAHSVFERFREDPDHRQFQYREAVLNPTNPKDKADAFETRLIEEFRQQSNPKETSGFRDGPQGRLFYIARPIRVDKESCLECHGAVERAPKSMVALYGTRGGFDWQLNEIVGAQAITVPARSVLSKARQSLLVTLSVVVVVFAIAIFLVNLWLERYVVRPINRMAATAETVSLGDTKADFVKQSDDEVGKLAESFNRMRLSLDLAMQRLERNRRRGQSDITRSQDS